MRMERGGWDWGPSPSTEGVAEALTRPGGGVRGADEAGGGAGARTKPGRRGWGGDGRPGDVFGWRTRPGSGIKGWDEAEGGAKGRDRARRAGLKAGTVLGAGPRAGRRLVGRGQGRRRSARGRS